MVENKEIAALFHLIDDPDEEVFHSVTNKLISFGRSIIPNLEDLWENSPDTLLQARIELIIQKLHFRDLTEEFLLWKNGNCELLQGALLVSKMLYPDQSPTQALHEIEKIRRNIWLELNSYLTPLEQASVISGILYSYYKIQGNEISYEIPEDFLVSKLIENKRGNAFSNGILYLVLCEMLDVPVYAIQIPKQFILAYFDAEYHFPDINAISTEKIKFFLDPLNGQVYSQKDVNNYFKSLSVPSVPSYYRPMDNKKVIQHLLEELAKCYNSPSAIQRKNDLLSLSSMLDE